MILRSGKKLNNERDNESTWELLPAKNLQHIFKNLHIIDVEKCLEVCRHWFNEANFYLKDKFWLSVEKVSSAQDFVASKRRFQFLLVIQDKESTSKLEMILDFLRHRKTEDQILMTQIVYNDYRSLSRILQVLHEKHVKKLTLVNKTRKHHSSRNCQRLELKFQRLDYGCLSSVENLTVVNCEKSLLNISRSFGNLKILKLNNCEFPGFEQGEYVSRDLLRNFINWNPLKELYLEDASFILTDDLGNESYFEVENLLSFENVKNLQILHLRTLTSDRDIEVLSTHFEPKRTVVINNIPALLLLPGCINRLMQIPNVICKGYVDCCSSEFFDYRIWWDSWTNSRNLNITKLGLCLVYEDCIRVFMKCFPNLKFFDCFLICQDIQTTIFSEMSKKWPQLESLFVGFFRYLLPSGRNEFFDFPNLTNFGINQCPTNKEGLIELMTYLRAVNLKAGSFKISFRFSYDEEVYQSFIDNFSKIGCLKFIVSVEFDWQLIKKYKSRWFAKSDQTFVYCFYDHSKTISASKVNEEILKFLIAIFSRKWLKAPENQPLDFEQSTLERFSQDIGAVTEFKNGVPRRMLLSKMDILFVKIKYIK